MLRRLVAAAAGDVPVKGSIGNLFYAELAQRAADKGDYTKLARTAGAAFRLEWARKKLAQRTTTKMAATASSSAFRGGGGGGGGLV